MRYNYNDGSIKIDLDEELDMKACKTLRTVIDGYIMRYQPREFIIDLSDVKFMDRVNRIVKKAGFDYAALDLGGYKMGNLNRNI